MMRNRLSTLATAAALVAVLLLCVAQLLWRYQAAERRRCDAYRPYRLHGVPTPTERRQRAAQRAAAAILTAAPRVVGRAAVVYPTRLTRRPDLAATVAAHWAAAA